MRPSRWSRAKLCVLLSPPAAQPPPKNAGGDDDDGQDRERVGYGQQRMIDGAGGITPPIWGTADDFQPRTGPMLPPASSVSAPISSRMSTMSQMARSMRLSMGTNVLIAISAKYTTPHNTITPMSSHRMLIASAIMVASSAELARVRDQSAVVHRRGHGLLLFLVADARRQLAALIAGDKLLGHTFRDVQGGVTLSGCVHRAALCLADDWHHTPGRCLDCRAWSASYLRMAKSATS